MFIYTVRYSIVFQKIQPKLPSAFFGCRIRAGLNGFSSLPKYSLLLHLSGIYGATSNNEDSLYDTKVHKKSSALTHYLSFAL